MLFREAGMRPRDAAQLEFWEEWLLIEGYNKLSEESDAAPDGASYDYPDQGIASLQENDAGHFVRPYYPSRHEKMATAEELISLGVQYRQE